MDEPVWLTRRDCDAIHFLQIREHGGASGLRDENALESALARPRQRLAYEPESDLAALAAAYGYGLASNHAYNDGNKRVAFLAMYVFLGLNGWELEAPEPEVVETMLALAAGHLEEEELRAWLLGHMIRAEEQG
ncbi:MAG: type II toxin-antitoxin system death-on-curing family toxin [Holophagales bacterium]|nr:type II toxin-antitoxin system death-on-curing family toxin [Holophagales bacterium]